jgi:acetyltransferase-like isoleucine patch superfamily enzyme
MNKKEFKNLFLKTIHNNENHFHPLVLINGNPKIGKGTTIGFFSEINAKEVEVIIGNNCDIASFVAINSADSHLRCVELDDSINRQNITIENNVFIGSHSVILGGVKIGHHSVIAAGTVVRHGIIPPFSLVIGTEIKPGYYKAEYDVQNISAEDV